MLDEQTSTQKPLWKTLVIALVTTVFPAFVGYVVHVYNVYQENARIERQIQLEQQQYDLELQKAKEGNLKSYVPGLISADQNEQRLSVIMLTVLHPEEAPNILQRVSSVIAADMKNSAKVPVPSSSKSFTPKIPAMPMASRTPLSAAQSRTYLEKKKQAVQALPHSKWYVVIQSSNTKDILMKVKENYGFALSAQIIYEKKTKVWMLVQGPYPTKEVAKRARIRISRKKGDLSTPFIVDAKSWDIQ